jgi:hypothetical protein
LLQPPIGHKRTQQRVVAVTQCTPPSFAGQGLTSWASM